jgi:beta-N-acetylhexosaminidase
MRIRLSSGISPGAMSMAAVDDPSLTKQIYAATAEELRMLGVNWAYSPVADVNSEMKNPVIGVRSFGDGMLTPTLTTN